jgi:hypothetical protein
MLNRPTVFIRAVDEDGVEGWGEVRSNFPAPGAEHRARLVSEVLAPGLIGRRFDGPVQAFEILTKGTEMSRSSSSALPSVILRRLAQTGHCILRPLRTIHRLNAAAQSFLPT